VPGAGLDDDAAYVTAADGTRTWAVTDPLGSVAAHLASMGAASQVNRYDE